jgi:hypothetical protein
MTLTLPDLLFGWIKIALGNTVFASKTHPNVVVTESPRIKSKKGIKNTKEQREGNIQNIKKRGWIR